MIEHGSCLNSTPGAVMHFAESLESPFAAQDLPSSFDEPRSRIYARAQVILTVPDRAILTESIDKARQRWELASCLSDHKASFTWPPKIMSNIIISIISGRPRLFPGRPSADRWDGRTTLDRKLAFDSEVGRLINCGSIAAPRCLEWLANILAVRSKNGMFRMCLDFVDLANVRSDFPLQPHVSGSFGQISCC